MAEVLSAQALCTQADVTAYLPDGATDPDLVIRLANAASDQLTNLAGREFVAGNAARVGGVLQPIAALERNFSGEEILRIPSSCPEWSPRRALELSIGDAFELVSVAIEHLDGSTTAIALGDVTILPRRRLYSWQPIEGLGFKSSTSISPSDEILVTAKWGFPSVPERLRQEAIRAAATWYVRDVRRSGATFAANEQTGEPAPDAAHVLPRSGFETALSFRRFRFG